MSFDVHRHFHDELSHVKVRLLTMGEDRAGYLVEMAPTEELFTRPTNQLTEDYITGRFG